MRLSILLLFSITAVISLHSHHHQSSAGAKPIDQSTISETSTTPEPTTTTTLVPLSPEPANHRINFLGLKHDYNSDEEAKQALANNLKAITGYDEIIVESIDEQGASWHLGGMLGSTDQDCPEQEIRQIVAKIKEPNETEFTREFKMWIDERFLRPSQVQILWLGPCGNVGRKRSRIETGPGSNAIIEMADSSIEELMPTTTNETTSIVAVTSVSNPLVEANLTTTSTTTAEPKQPTTTTESPTTQPPIETSTSTAATAGESTLPTFAPLPLENFDIPDMPSINFTITGLESNITTNDTITTTSPAITTLKPEVPKETSAAPSTVPPPTTTKTVATPEPTSTSTKSLGAPTTTVVPPLSSEEGAAGLDGQGESSGPHYGKYIGFSAAFLIFVAYLVCSRAYKRHGMYELHSE